MIEPAVVILRLIQYSAAAILMGSPLFFLYALPASGPGSAVDIPWARRLLAGAGLALSLGAASGLVAQSALLAGSIIDGLKIETLGAVVSGMDLGKVAVVRTLAAMLATVLVLRLAPGRASWIAAAGLGTLCVSSFPWMGHGAATEGALRLPHLIADMAHGWAAAVWLGALVVFLGLLSARPTSSETTIALHRPLHRFSGVGTALVTVLIASGLINSWILVGPDRIAALWTSPYGRLLTLKLALFVAMLGLAATNRLRLTPALSAGLHDEPATDAALAALRRSVQIETAAGMAVLALVAWFGTLAPPASM